RIEVPRLTPQFSSRMVLSVTVTVGLSQLVSRLKISPLTSDWTSRIAKTIAARPMSTAAYWPNLDIAQLSAAPTSALGLGGLAGGGGGGGGVLPAGGGGGGGGTASPPGGVTSAGSPAGGGLCSDMVLLGRDNSGRSSCAGPP